MSPFAYKAGHILTKDGHFCRNCCGTELAFCNKCRPGTTWPLALNYVFHDAPGTCDMNFVPDPVPTGIWDGDPLDVSLFPSTPDFTAHNAYLYGEPCVWDDAGFSGNLDVANYLFWFQLLWGYETSQYNGATPTDMIGASPDDVCIHVAINNDQASNINFNQDWVRVLHPNVALNGIPDCRTFLPLTIGPADFHRIWHNWPFHPYPDIHHLDFRQVSFTIQLP